MWVPQHLFLSIQLSRALWSLTVPFLYHMGLGLPNWVKDLALLPWALILHVDNLQGRIFVNHPVEMTQHSYQELWEEFMNGVLAQGPRQHLIQGTGRLGGRHMGRREAELTRPDSDKMVLLSHTLSPALPTSYCPKDTQTLTAHSSSLG